MDPTAQRQKGRGKVIHSLNVAIETLNLAKEISSITPAKAVFGSVSVLLTMIKDSMANDEDCVELGLACVDVCTALNRGLDGKRMNELNNSVCEAINQLMLTVAQIQKKIGKRRGRWSISKSFNAKGDREEIATWRSDLNRFLLTFNTELAINTNVAVSEMRNDLAKFVRSTPARSGTLVVIAESPPPPPRAFFGRNEFITKIIDFVEQLTPIALIGAGGIGKTTIALTVLHDDRIKQWFGDDRRFIACDQFSASSSNFLNRLSKVIGASVQNPEGLTPLRPFLSSKKMLIVLDNAESILDPQGTDAREIYAMVDELSRFSNICLCVTSRISTIPHNCKRLDVSTLSMDAARNTFYDIYNDGEQSGLVDNILEQLEFHPLSIALLATVAHHNRWDTKQLTKEWKSRRTGVLHTEHNESLSATIELSLTSPMFQQLGPDARELLGIVAFFPQGVGEDNLDWLFPTIPDRRNIFNKFCILSLTYRSNGFITMLAPLRDHLSPKDPKSSPLLCTTKEHYISRLSVYLHPGRPSFEEAQLVLSEDVNAEHLLDVFTSIDTNSDDVWEACRSFMEHLYWHKPRLVVLGPKIEGLSDDHPSKPKCLYQLSWLFQAARKFPEYKRLLTHALKLWRERGEDAGVAQTLRHLADANRMLGLLTEGIPQAEEGLEIYTRLNDISGEGRSLCWFAWLLLENGQLKAAEAAASRAIDLFTVGGEEPDGPCECHRILGQICHSKGKTMEAIDHLKKALMIVSSLNAYTTELLVLRELAELYIDQAMLDDAYACVERIKSHIKSPFEIGRIEELQVRLEVAKSRALRAAAWKS